MERKVKSEKVKRFFQTGILVLLVSWSFVLLGEEPSFSLFFRPNPVPLTYLATYHAQTTDVLNISQASGEDQILKNTSIDTIEVQKDLTRIVPGGVTETGEGASPAAQTLETEVRQYFIKKVDKGRPAKSIQPQQKKIRQSATGRMIEPFEMEDVVAFGLPISFPTELVGIGSAWDKKSEIRGEDLPVMTLHQDYKLNRVIDLNNRKVAEIDYSFRAGLQTTQITNDPEILSKISELKGHNIESVSFEGAGRVAFDIERGTQVTQDLTMNRRIRKTTIRGEERIMQDLLTLYEFTEALTN